MFLYMVGNVHFDLFVFWHALDFDFDFDFDLYVFVFMEGEFSLCS